MAMNRSQIMSRIRSVSGIERVPEFLKPCHLRRQPKGVFGKPDFANKSKKVALFIDGCYWHFHETHIKMPKTNQKFWEKKFQQNRERDKLVTKTLKEEGWVVYRIWECELKRLA